MGSSDREPPMKPGRRFRFSLRTLLLLIAAASLLMGYVASYHWLSRRGMEQANAMQAPGFLYVTWEEAAATKDLTRHHRLANFYFPLNQIDQRFFETQGPITGITWQLE